MNDRFYSNARAFVATVRAGSMTAAARDLKSTKSGISQKVSSFEAELELTLLDRSARSVTPTAAGRRIFEICAPMVDAAIEAEARLGEGAGKEISGRVAVSGPNSFLTTVVLPIIPEFTRSHPKARVVLKASDWNMDFAADDIDLGFRIGPILKGRFIKKHLSTTRRQLCASPGFLKRHAGLTRPSDLAGIPCVLRQQEAPSWHLQGPGDRAETVSPSHALLVDTMEMALAAAMEGAGVALLPSLIAQADISDRKLVPVLPQWHSEALDITLLCRPNSLKKPQVATLRRVLIDCCGN